MIKLNLKKFNIYTIISVLLLLAGLLHYIYWGIRYGVWYDIGIYSITIVLVIPGIIGIIFTLMEEEKED
jgi:membrane protein DedA with SNARE-associated domain